MGIYRETIHPFLRKYFARILIIIIILAAVFLGCVYRFGLNIVLSFVLSLLLAILYNPVFWVSVFGPFIQSFHFLWLRSKLGIGYKAKVVGELPDDLKEEEAELEELRKVLNENEWSYAFNDFSTQLFVTLISFIFLILSILKVFVDFYSESFGPVIKKIIYNDTQTLLILIFISIFFVFGMYVLLSGKLISHQILKYYKPTAGKITGETRFPPLKSGLTIFRYAITIYSIFYSIWLNEKVPILMKKIMDPELIKHTMGYF